MWIKICWPPKDFRGNLVLLQCPRMFKCVVCQVPQQLTKCLGTMQGMTIDQLFNLQQAPLRISYMSCYNHVTEVNKGFRSTQHSHLQAVTVTNPLRLSKP